MMADVPMKDHNLTSRMQYITWNIICNCGTAYDINQIYVNIINGYLVIARQVTFTHNITIFYI